MKSLSRIRTQHGITVGFITVCAVAALLIGPMRTSYHFGQTAAASGATRTYIVLYNALAVPANAAKKFANAGGTPVYAYNQIGVAIATSDNAAFRSNLMAGDSLNQRSGRDRSLRRHAAHGQ